MSADQNAERGVRGQRVVDWYMDEHGYADNDEAVTAMIGDLFHAYGWHLGVLIDRASDRYTVASPQPPRGQRGGDAGMAVEGIVEHYAPTIASFGRSVVIIGVDEPRHVKWVKLIENPEWWDGSSGISRYLLHWGHHDEPSDLMRPIDAITLLAPGVILGTHPNLVGPIGAVEM